MGTVWRDEFEGPTLDPAYTKQGAWAHTFDGFGLRATGLATGDGLLLGVVDAGLGSMDEYTVELLGYSLDSVATVGPWFLDDDGDGFMLDAEATDGLSLWNVTAYERTGARVPLDSAFGNRFRIRREGSDYHLSVSNGGTWSTEAHQVVGTPVTRIGFGCSQDLDAASEASLSLLSISIPALANPLGQSHATPEGLVTVPHIVIAGTSQVTHFDVNGGLMAVTPSLVLNLSDTEFEQAPVMLQASVMGANSGAALTFAIDGEDVWTDDANEMGYLGETSFPSQSDLLAGAHVLTVTSPDNGSDEVEFTVLYDPLPSIDTALDTPPVWIDGSEGRWILQDLHESGLGSWILPINPRTMAPPHVERQMTTEHTTAVTSGVDHVAESSMKAVEWPVAGYCPDEDFYNQLLAYANIPRRFYAIDHRARAWKVMLVSLFIEPRKRQTDEVSDDNDWAGNYEMVFYVLDGPVQLG